MTPRAGPKILPMDRLLNTLAPLRADGQTVALANGLFDLLHVGHLRYLEGAKREADLLVVAVNADATARALKGPLRPVVPEDERAELVAGFSCVDWVTVFAELDVSQVLRRLRPDVHCKGTDYTAETVPEREVALELEFGDLALAQRRVGAGEQGDGLLPERSRHFGGAGSRKSPARMASVLDHLALTEVAHGQFAAARNDLLRAGYQSAEAMPFLYDVAQMLVPVAQVQKQAAAFDDYLVSAEPDSASLQTAALRQIFQELLAACSEPQE